MRGEVLLLLAKKNSNSISFNGIEALVDGSDDLKCEWPLQTR